MFLPLARMALDVDDYWGRMGVYSRGWARRAFQKDEFNYPIR